ncbi:MAG: hypothetical protein HYT79_07490 [Elusimicrobia bacterium]|nr:hypothetical protein [Elusimicrobiota bacterium]
MSKKSLRPPQEMPGQRRGFSFGRALILTLMLLGAGALFSTKINMCTADLGRHLKNGELAVTQGLIPQANLYSYTHSEFPFVNHHWGAGVFFYLTHRYFGFQGLSFVFVCLSLATLLLFFDQTAERVGFEWASALTLVFLPLTASRVEIRPEAVSYCLAGVFFWVLSRVRSGRLPMSWLWALPVLGVLWVNMHIYFILGPVLIGAFALEALFSPRADLKRRLWTVLALTMAAALMNPLGVKGAVYPFFIFREYGYRLFENQSVWFLQRIVSYPPGLYFKIALGLMIAAWVSAGWFLVKRREASDRWPIAELCLTFFVMGLAVKAVRNFALFGFMGPAFAGAALAPVFFRREPAERLPVDRWGRLPNSSGAWAWISGLVLAGVVLWRINPGYFIGRGAGMGWGVIPGIESSARFFLREKIQGPIFNNYDIGGYLIYYLYPNERVYVDNRPEAYPASFFQDGYMAPQENDDRWQELLRRWNFNAIFFYRHDLTPWGQNFLIRRSQDRAEWAPVYVDGAAIIFLRRTAANRTMIEKYELPKEMFSVRRSGG